MAIVKLNIHLTSKVFESKGSFQAGFSQPTLAERSVRLRYLGAMSEGYWETPLSTPSIASTNSYVSLVSGGPGARWEKEDLVQFEPECPNGRVSRLELESARNDFLAKVSAP